MKIRRSLVPLLVVACTGLLTACGGGDGDSSAARSDDPTSEAISSASGTGPTGDAGDGEACDLLTPDEVAAAVGSPVQEGTASSGPAVTGGSFSSCVWQSADPDSPADTATVTIYPNADAADSAREADSQDVEGIGDDAFSASFASMWVLVGDRSLFAQWYAFSGSDEDSLVKSQALARAAADALG